MKTTKLSKQTIGLIKKSISGMKLTSAVLPIIENVFINDGNIEMTDLKNTLTIKNVGIEGRFLMLQKNLITIMDMLPEFQVSHNDVQAVFNSPDQSERLKYDVDQVGDFPKKQTPEYGEQFTITPADFERIQTAVKFIGKDELRPAMMHVCLHDGEVAATDAHLMYWEASDLKLGSDLLLNATVIKLMAIFSAAGNFNLQIGANYFKLENDACEIVSRIQNERYPNYREVIPTEFYTTLTVDKKPFVEALTKADKMANKVTHQVAFDIQAKSFKLSAEDIDLGTEYSKDLSAQSKITGEAIEIGFNAQFMLKVCSMVDTTVIKLEMREPNRAAIVNNNILIMPVMLAKYK